MKFKTIERKVDAFVHSGKNRELAYRCWDLIGYAINNADDTIREGGSEKEYLQIARTSLQCLICDCRDQEVINWYRKQGFDF